VGGAADATPATLFLAGDATARAQRWLRLPDRLPASPFAAARHADGVETFVIERERPIPALALTLLAQALAEHCGPRLLRLKGIVALAEAPDQPTVVHAVQHVISPLTTLPAWTDGTRTSRLVFITRGVPRHFAARLLEIIEAEVMEELARR
jgi:G3E family GTPase